VAKSCDIAIIGAGPYGLSLAAHLAAAGADFRIFGRPMSTWRSHMPRGMLLKSDGSASNLSAPDPKSRLKAWCSARGIEFNDHYIPVPLSAFCDYAAWFQRTYVPKLDVRQVSALAAMHPGFALTLDNGERIEAAKVVMAVGISHFAHMPEALAGFSPQLVSHSHDNRDLAQFAGRQVLVLGAGASAVDTAVLASEAGAHVSLLARTPVLHYRAMAQPDAVSWLGSPALYRHLPAMLRRRAARRDLAPAPGWFMRGKMDGRVLEYLGYRLQTVREHDGRMQVTATGREGQPLTLAADHVIAATGYRPDLRRLPFLDSGMLDAIAHTAHAPRLSARFETSLRGLYAVGPLAAGSFGPMMRFLAGAGYAAPLLAAHLARTARARRGKSGNAAAVPATSAA
jgi:cation diffusion facilitator CzcD-associated flavoprotein CzcO